MKNSLKKFVPDVFLHPNVHQDIQGVFGSMQRQLVGSYFDYEMIDTAAIKAVLHLEMALKIRYHEVTQEYWNEKEQLQKLLKWFQDEGVFRNKRPYFFKLIAFCKKPFCSSNHAFV